MRLLFGSAPRSLNIAPHSARRALQNVTKPDPRRDFGHMSMWEVLFWPTSASAGDFVALCIPRDRRRAAKPSWPHPQCAVYRFAPDSDAKSTHPSSDIEVCPDPARRFTLATQAVTTNSGR